MDCDGKKLTDAQLELISKPINTYTIVRQNYGLPFEMFEKTVSMYCNNGWEPVGGAIVEQLIKSTQPLYSQALIKRSHNRRKGE